MTRRLLAAALLAAAPLAGGCGQSAPNAERTPAVQKPPLERAKLMVSGYANGQPVASEAADWPQLVDEVKQSDPAKGEALKKGLDEIKANPAGAKAKAKELLGKL